MQSTVVVQLTMQDRNEAHQPHLHECTPYTVHMLVYGSASHSGGSGMQPMIILIILMEWQFACMFPHSGHNAAILSALHSPKS